MDAFKEELERLKTELIALGEDPGELDFWHNFYDLMEDNEKLDLLHNFKHEVEELKELKKRG